MSFLEIAKRRYSCRSYKNQTIEEEKILQVLEAGRIAPSAVNLQPWRFIVIKEEENRKRICTTYKREWLKQAPVIIVVCGNHKESWKRSDGKDYCDIDIAITVDHMTLMATDSGLATCWICNFDKNKCSEILCLPEYLEPIVLLPLGYPYDKVNPDRHETSRKKYNQIIFREKF